jgi:hypothetical protein
MGALNALMKLIQLGGIGASMAFLLLGYNLLRKEQSRDGDARQNILNSIHEFLRYSLIFFGCGVSAYIAIFFMERHFHIQKSIASSQLRFSAWHFQGANQRIEVSLEETTFSDSPFIQQEDRGQYDVYIAARQPAPTRFSEGEYPVMIGPFDFGRRPDVSASVTEQQVFSWVRAVSS